ncbi:hypothetical protein DT73_18475 [Mangrovibacter sp. MFB070]|nr:hypothetical protein DT73_18475 [Mangrovibacter sp. MFB070]
MTNLISAQNEWMSPNKNQENQFIDFRLLTKKKEKPRFFLLFHQSQPARRRVIFIDLAQGHPTLT